MTKNIRDTFSAAIGPAPSGEGEEITLRRVDLKDPMVVKDTFLLRQDETQVLLEFLIDHPVWQRWILGSLSSRGLIPPTIP